MKAILCVAFGVVLLASGTSGMVTFQLPDINPFIYWAPTFPCLPGKKCNYQESECIKRCKKIEGKPIGFDCVLCLSGGAQTKTDCMDKCDGRSYPETCKVYCFGSKPLIFPCLQQCWETKAKLTKSNNLPTDFDCGLCDSDAAGKIKGMGRCHNDVCKGYCFVPSSDRCLKKCKEVGKKVTAGIECGPCRSKSFQEKINCMDRCDGLYSVDQKDDRVACMGSCFSSQRATNHCLDQCKKVKNSLTKLPTGFDCNRCTYEDAKILCLAKCQANKRNPGKLLVCQGACFGSP